MLRLPVVGVIVGGFFCFALLWLTPLSTSFVLNCFSVLSLSISLLFLIVIALWFSSCCNRSRVCMLCFFSLSLSLSSVSYIQSYFSFACSLILSSVLFVLLALSSQPITTNCMQR